MYEYFHSKDIGKQISYLFGRTTSILNDGLRISALMEHDRVEEP